MASYLPGTTPAYPDVVGGQLSQTYGNPAFPGTLFSGPLLAGSVQGSDGSNNLAGVGGTIGTANVGFCVVGKSCVINQATNNGATGQFVCPIVIPAQSQILRMTLMVTTAWTSTTTAGIGSSASATAFTTSAGVTGLGTLGINTITPGTNATAIGNWDNVGTSDVQIVVLSGGTGSGVGTLTVEWLQGINSAS
jgi:hypothetical protein